MAQVRILSYVTYNQCFEVMVENGKCGAVPCEEVEEEM